MGRAIMSSRVPRWTGHIAWPKYGFDMCLDNKEQRISLELPKEELDLRHLFLHYPKNLYLCNTVQDVYEHENGEHWWDLCGMGWFMYLNCSSITWKFLKDNLEKKGHDVHGQMNFNHKDISEIDSNLSKLKKSQYKARGSVTEIDNLLREGKLLSAPQLPNDEFSPIQQLFLSNDFMN